ncbi:MAG: hypothetical protein JSS20_02575 [Proteobacteria bacterium]|nr:hypothetical protein [Pseudomonadota bacterium]
MGLVDMGRDVVVAAFDAAAGRRRRRYECSVDIEAPSDVVWSMLKARDVVFEGHFPLRVIGEPVPGQSNLERVVIMVGSTRLQMMTRIVDECPGQAILYQLLPEGTDPALIEGDDDYIGFVLIPRGERTRLDLTRETSPKRALSRLTIPMGLRSGAKRYKRKAEDVARLTPGLQRG